jgi:hypothetical protein
VPTLRACMPQLHEGSWEHSSRHIRHRSEVWKQAPAALERCCFAMLLLLQAGLGSSGSGGTGQESEHSVRGPLNPAATPHGVPRAAAAAAAVGGAVAATAAPVGVYPVDAAPSKRTAAAGDAAGASTTPSPRGAAARASLEGRPHADSDRDTLAGVTVNLAGVLPCCCCSHCPMQPCLHSAAAHSSAQWLPARLHVLSR